MLFWFSVQPCNVLLLFPTRRQQLTQCGLSHLSELAEPSLLAFMLILFFSFPQMMSKINLTNYFIFVSMIQSIYFFLFRGDLINKEWVGSITRRI